MSVARLLDRMDPETRALAQAAAGERLSGKLVALIKPFMGKLITSGLPAAIEARLGIEMVQLTRTEGWRCLCFGTEGLKRRHLELVPSRREVPWRLAWISPVLPGTIAEDKLVVLLERPGGTLMTFRATGAWLAGMLGPGELEGAWHE